MSTVCTLYGREWGSWIVHIHVEGPPEMKCHLFCLEMNSFCEFCVVVRTTRGIPCSCEFWNISQVQDTFLWLLSKCQLIHSDDCRRPQHYDGPEMRMRRQPSLPTQSLLLPLPWFFSCEAPYSYSIGFPGSSVVKNPPALQEMVVQSLGQEDPLKKEMSTHSSILTWEIPMDRGAWWGTDHGVAKGKRHKLATEQHSSPVKGESEVRRRPFLSWTFSSHARGLVCIHLCLHVLPLPGSLV